MNASRLTLFINATYKLLRVSGFNPLSLHCKGVDGLQGMTLLLRRPYHDLATTIEGAFPELLSALKDKDQFVRMTAALLIGEFSKQCKVSLLVSVSVLTWTL
jgi:hypothetical protein